MVALLLSVGAAGVMASLFALGFGFANNGFDLGNTLIVAGASGLGSSLVLIGLAVVVRELRRLGDAQPARLASRGSRAPEPAEAQVSPARAVAQRVPFPPRPVPEPPREPPLREPRVAEARGGSEYYDEPETERGRANIFAAARGSAQPQAAEPDMAPFPPLRAAQQPLAPPLPPPPMPPAVAPLPASESPYEAKFGPADILARLGSSRAKPEAARDLPRPPAGNEAAAEPAPQYQPSEPPRRPESARSGRGGAFESAWPMEKQARASQADADARAAKPEPRPEPKFEPMAEPKFEPKYEPKFEPRRSRPEPPPLQSAVVAPPPLPAAPAPAHPPEARTASILKSGVIDGMAYTLYTDGSIEAQLPQGTVHFTSIEELRLHLERNA